MPTVIFQPSGTAIDVEENTKILVAGRRAKVPIRFGCAACSCGTCAVKVDVRGTVSEMKDNERALLNRMKLPVDGTVRLSCQTRVMQGAVDVDLAFQETYSPDQGDDDF